MSNLQTLVAGITAMRSRLPREKSVLVAVTGIDASGKSYLTRQLVDELGLRGLRSAGICVDGWLNLPHRRFDISNPAEHFYRHAIRFDELFGQLVFPLRERRSLRLEADHAEETASTYRKHVYEFHDIDVIVLEGIYLLKREFRTYYDLSVWVDCSFATALERAVARAQEGLTPAETTRAYRSVFFPAQEIHFARDEPKANATMVVSGGQASSR